MKRACAKGKNLQITSIIYKKRKFCGQEGTILRHFYHERQNVIKEANENLYPFLQPCFIRLSDPIPFSRKIIIPSFKK
jgi:NADH pyrophosphatase NudC (nudix superfamily)